MWTRVTTTEFDNFLTETRLEEFREDIALLKTQNHVYLPRYIWKYHPHPALERVTDPEFQVKPIKLKFKAELRPEQQRIVNQIFEYWRTADILSGIIEATPGTGKTVLAIYLATQLGYKTCIIVNNRKLIEQWVSEFKKFTDIADDEIEIVQRRLPSPDTKVSIVYVQTLLSKIKRDFTKAYEEMRKCGIGLVFYDEAHQMSAGPRYAKVSTLFATPILMGLTATPFASGLQKILLHGTLGDVIAKGGQLLPCTIRRIMYHSGLKNYFAAIASLKEPIMRKTKFNTLIAKSRTCQWIIADQCNQLLQEGRQIVIITTTVEHVKTLAEFLQALFLNNKIQTLYHENTKVDRDVDIIVATYKMGSHGFNLPTLSAIIFPILLTGRTSIKQCVGRVGRFVKGKPNPIIVDLEDLELRQLFQRDYIIKRKVMKAHLNIERFEHLIASVDHNGRVRYSISSAIPQEGK